MELKWSDDSSSTSYRSYSELFDFQCDLLTEFPKEGGSQKGTQRTIPYLPGKKMFQKSTLKLAESRLPQIDDYVKTLVSMPENITRSELTCRFFRSNWQEDKLMNKEESSVRYSIRHMGSRDQLLSAPSPSPEAAEIVFSEEEENIRTEI